jgi:predicted RND superfamily exporter protein
MPTRAKNMNQTSRTDPRAARRGVALLLALLAVVVASVVAVSYVATQSTAVAVARNITRHAEQTDLDVKLTGANYLLALMSRTLVLTQIRSLLIAIILILSCIALTLRSGKLGLIAAIPNLVPLLILFGLMGWGGVMLSTATTMIASVALGLIVDDTIHLLYGYRRATQTGLTSPQALQHAIRHTGPALVITTLILTLGFWAGLVGSFKPTVSFAFLTGLTMLTALLADLLVLPAILLIRNPKGPRHRATPN